MKESSGSEKQRLRLSAQVVVATISSRVSVPESLTLTRGSSVQLCVLAVHGNPLSICACASVQEGGWVCRGWASSRAEPVNELPDWSPQSILQQSHVGREHVLSTH